jgi:hypothetical protein
LKHSLKAGLLIALWLLTAAAQAQASTASPPAYETFGYLFVLFLHQVLFVFWLGPDIGVYMWSTKVVNPALSAGQRLAAGRIMQVIGVLPQVCMSLMLTVGGVLTELMGIDHPWWQMAAIWLLGPVWLSLTLWVYTTAGTEKGARLAQLDIWFRWLIVVSVPLSVIYSVSTGRLAGFPWIMAKLLLFAAVVFFSLRMRQRLLPFITGLDRLASEGPSPELDATLRSSISRARLFMFASWAALAAAAALGMIQPGTA